MSGLPTRIPAQSVPIGKTSDGKQVYAEIDWYLPLLNLFLNAFGAPSSSGGAAPVSPSDAFDMANLLAETADIPQAYRGLANIEALLSLQTPPGADIAQAYRGLANLAARLSVQSLPDGADIARMRRELANALLLALGAPAVDPVPTAQPAQTVTVGASPFTYTALFNGALAVSGGTVSAISIIRQGVTVATGVTAGVIPLRRLDEVQITYTSAPTVLFLPS